MPSRRMLIAWSRAAFGVWLSFFIFNGTGCKSPPPKPSPPAPAPATAAAAPVKTPPIIYSAAYDKDIKEIMDLAGKDRWEEAEVKASLLHDRAPHDPIVERVYSWITQSGEKRREQKLEDKIRDIDSRNSVFSPSFSDLIKEKKDRGLPATKDVRDTVHRIESTPYIPESYGKTDYEKGPMFDFESTKGRMFKVLDKEV
ncbi:MAG TPA: hypothetical protein VHH88_06190, partial [Verrucomicrobiae bacterium]|nr:hypothetical protein [Verrucomicrobiae bacterium]